MASNGINKVILIGNLGRDPELKYTNSGTPVTTLNVAVGEARKDPQSNKMEPHTEWVSVVCYGQTAQNIHAYLRKGRQIYVEGRLQTRTYEKDGQKRYFTEVIANQVLFLSNDSGRGGDDERSFDQSERPAGPPAGRGPARAAPPRGRAEDGYDDDRGFEQDQRAAPAPARNPRAATPPPPARGNQNHAADDDFFDEDLPF